MSYADINSEDENAMYSTDDDDFNPQRQSQYANQVFPNDNGDAEKYGEDEGIGGESIKSHDRAKKVEPKKRGRKKDGATKNSVKSKKEKLYTDIDDIEQIVNVGGESVTFGEVLTHQPVPAPSTSIELQVNLSKSKTKTMAKASGYRMVMGEGDDRVPIKSTSTFQSRKVSKREQNALEFEKRQTTTTLGSLIEDADFEEIEDDGVFYEEGEEEAMDEEEEAMDEEEQEGEELEEDVEDKEHDDDEFAFARGSKGRPTKKSKSKRKPRTMNTTHAKGRLKVAKESLPIATGSHMGYFYERKDQSMNLENELLDLVDRDEALAKSELEVFNARDHDVVIASDDEDKQNAKIAENIFKRANVRSSSGGPLMLADHSADANEFGNMGDTSFFGPNVAMLWNAPDRKRKKSKPRMSRRDATRLPEKLRELWDDAQSSYVEGNLDKAVKILSKVLKDAPKMSAVYKMMALIYEDSNMPELALSMYTLAAKFHKAPKTISTTTETGKHGWLLVFNYAMKLCAYDHALMAIDRALNFDKSSGEMMKMKMKTLIFTRRWEKAWRVYVIYIRKIPTHFHQLLDVAQEFATYGKPEKAYVIYGRYIFRCLGVQYISREDVRYFGLPIKELIETDTSESLNSGLHPSLIDFDTLHSAMISMIDLLLCGFGGEPLNFQAHTHAINVVNSYKAYLNRNDEVWEEIIPAIPMDMGILFAVVQLRRLEAIDYENLSGEKEQRFEYQLNSALSQVKEVQTFVDEMDRIAAENLREFEKYASGQLFQEEDKVNVEEDEWKEDEGHGDPLRRKIGYQAIPEEIKAELEDTVQANPHETQDDGIVDMDAPDLNTPSPNRDLFFFRQRIRLARILYGLGMKTRASKMVDSLVRRSASLLLQARGSSLVTVTETLEHWIELTKLLNLLSRYEEAYDLLADMLAWESLEGFEATILSMMAINAYYHISEAAPYQRRTATQELIDEYIERVREDFENGREEAITQHTEKERSRVRIIERQKRIEKKIDESSIALAHAPNSYVSSELLQDNDDVEKAEELDPHTVPTMTAAEIEKEIDHVLSTEKKAFDDRIDYLQSRKDPRMAEDELYVEDLDYDGPYRYNKEGTKAMMHLLNLYIIRKLKKLIDDKVFTPIPGKDEYLDDKDEEHPDLANDPAMMKRVMDVIAMTLSLCSAWGDGIKYLGCTLSMYKATKPTFKAGNVTTLPIIQRSLAVNGKPTYACFDEEQNSFFKFISGIAFFESVETALGNCAPKFLLERLLDLVAQHRDHLDAVLLQFIEATITKVDGVHPNIMDYKEYKASPLRAIEWGSWYTERGFVSPLGGDENFKNTPGVVMRSSHIVGLIGTVPNYRAAPRQLNVKKGTKRKSVSQKNDKSKKDPPLVRNVVGKIETETMETADTDTDTGVDTGVETPKEVGVGDLKLTFPQEPNDEPPTDSSASTRAANRLLLRQPEILKGRQAVDVDAYHNEGDLINNPKIANATFRFDLVGLDIADQNFIVNCCDVSLACAEAAYAFIEDLSKRSTLLPRAVDQFMDCLAVNAIFREADPVNLVIPAQKLLQTKRKADSTVSHLLVGHDSGDRQRRYGEALQHYVEALRLDPHQPLTGLCISSLLTNMANHYLVGQRNETFLKGMSFFQHYRNCRIAQMERIGLAEKRNEKDHSVTNCHLIEVTESLTRDSLEQEVMYNLGRTFQEVKLNSVATRCYLDVLAISDRNQASWVSPSFLHQNGTFKKSMQLTREAAHNLVCMYKSSGSPEKALDIMKRYLIVD